MSAPPSRSGALLLRVWTEEEAESRLRVRIMEVMEPTADPRVLTTVRSIDEVCAAVGDWLERFLAGPEAS